MRIGLGLLYWIGIGPGCFFLVVEFLLLPVTLTVGSTESDSLSAAPRMGVTIYSLLAAAAGAWFVWFLWRRYRGTVLDELAPWLSRPPRSRVLAAAVALVCIGATTVVVAAKNIDAAYFENAVLAGGLIQSSGLVALIVYLRRRTEDAAAQQGVEPDVE